MFAHDGLEALETIEQNPAIDMVVSDINMPRMDGLSLLAKLQECEDAARKSTVIVSAYGDMSNIRTAMNRGAFDFLTKPIDFGDLEATIDKTVRHVEMFREARRRQAEAERAHASLSRYFSPQIASRLASNGEDGNGMEVHRRDVATIFTDVTSFTTLVENIEPEVLSALLNEYTGGMTEIIFAHEGTVGKIIGDGIHILFNAPGDQPDYATRAIACAHDMDAWAEEFKARWRAKGVNFGVTRIGVHAGPALVGNLAAQVVRLTPPTATPSRRPRDCRALTGTWHPDLRQRICREGVGEFQGPPGGRHRAARPQRTASYDEPFHDEAFRRRDRRSTPKPSPSSRLKTPARCRPSPLWSACMPTIRSRASISSDCSTAPRASGCNSNRFLHMTSDFAAGNYRFIPACFSIRRARGDAGYEIERVRFHRWLPLAEGFAATAKYIQGAGGR